MDAAVCGGTGSYVKRSENWSRPIPSIGLRRHTTTTCSFMGALSHADSIILMSHSIRSLNIIEYQYYANFGN